MGLLRWLADWGPWVLVAGIAAGVTLPALAQVLVPWIPTMVAGLLFLAALRIGPSKMLVAMSGFPKTLAVILLLQLLFPLAVLALFGALDMLDNLFVVALVIIAMAPSISGAPNMVLMMGYDPAAAMKYLVAGTALLPLTVIPVLYFLPALGGIGEVVTAALRLLGVIFVSALAAFALRWSVMRAPGAEVIKAIDGASALLLAVVVIGLMSAVNAALWDAPREFWLWLAFVCVVNFGLQILGRSMTRQAAPDGSAALTVIAGNRNVALFLVALPAEVTAPLLIFIGCYQVPMYLTPLVTGRFLKGVK